MGALLRTFIITGLLSLLLGLFGAPQSLHAAEASLYISPSTGRRGVGETFQLVIRLNTGGQAINAAEGSVVFNPAMIEVVSISKTNSIFTLWTGEPTFSNAEGAVQFSGGLPSPGYSGSNGLLLTITLRGRAATTVNNSTNIALVSGAILANDGYGTNILTSLGRSSFFIAPRGAQEPSAPDEEPTSTADLPADTGPSVSSETHPDQQKWYAVSTPRFSWALPADVTGVSYLVTERPTSNPGNQSDGLVGTVSFPKVTDGIHYFHLKFRQQGAWGAIRHFRFQTDTVAPKEFTVTASQSADTTARPQILFETTDALSGIDRYSIRIDGTQETTVTPDLAGKLYTLSSLFGGTHEVRVTAVDRAGNTTSSQIQIQSDGINRPDITEAPRRTGSGQAVTIRGVAAPYSTVVVYFESLDATKAQIINDPRVVKTVTTTADASGNWAVEVDDIPDGRYRVQAYVQYADGSISLSSDPETVRVGGVMIGGIFGWLVDFFESLARLQEQWFVLSIILYTMLGLLAAHYVLPKITKAGNAYWRFQKKVRAARELQKDEHQLVKRLVGLQGEITKELKLLRDIGRHRSLYPDERYLRTKLTQYQKALKPASPQKRKRRPTLNVDS